MDRGCFDAQVDRKEAIRSSRLMAENWARWCSWRGEYGSPMGRYPRTKHGGIERQYLPPAQWESPKPRPQQPHDPSGLAFQVAFVKLPKVYRMALVVEFCIRPRLVRPGGYEGMVTAAIAAKMSPRLYPIIVDRALLAVNNILHKKKQVKLVS